MPTSPLETEFLRIARHPSPAAGVGAYRLWHDFSVTPAFRFDYLLAFHPAGRVIRLSARSGYSTEMASSLLRHFEASPVEDLSASLLTVRHGLALPEAAFDSVTYVPPAIASVFAHESLTLNGATAWLVPSFSCEFRSGHDGTAFWFGVRYGGIEAMDWSRAPAPLVRVQLLSRWPGGMLRYTKAPFFLRFASLGTILPALPLSVAGVRLISSSGQEVRVRRQNQDDFHVSRSSPLGAQEERLIPVDALVPYVQALLRANPFTAAGA